MLMRRPARVTCPSGHPQEIRGRHVDVLAQAAEVVRAGHQAVEDLARHRHEPRVRDPGAVVAVAGFAFLVGAHACERARVRIGIVLDRDLRGHAPHRERAAAMAALDHELRVGAQEMRGHGHAAAVRQHEPRPVPELLDEAEDVVPAPAVEPDDVVAQFMQDLVDLECGGDGLDEDRDLDRPVRQPEAALGMRDDLRPEPRLESVLELRQVEVRTRAPAQELGGVVVQVQAEVHECTRDRLVAVQPVLLGQVPAARPHDEHRGLFVEPVGLAFGGRVREVAAHRAASGWLDPRRDWPRSGTANPRSPP